MSLPTSDGEISSSPAAASASLLRTGVILAPATPHADKNKEHVSVPPSAEGMADITQITHPSSNGWYPSLWGKPVYGGNAEALAWVLDSMGRAVAFICSAAFLGTALLKLARQAAGCATDIDPDTGVLPECLERVYGLRPSSLLTTYTVIVGIVSATLLPIVGAIVDTTDCRLEIGQWSSIVFCSLLIPQISIGEATWEAVALLQLVIAVIGWAQTMVTYAYLPELTDDQVILNQYTQSFTTATFSTMVVFLGFVVGVAGVMGWGDIATARLGQSVAVLVSSVLLYVAWYRLFQPRPAARPRSENRPIWKDGFYQVTKTARKIVKHWPAVKWFYISIALVDAGVNSLATVAITYLTDTLGFTTQENGLAILALLLGSIPGGLTSGAVTARSNPILSSLGATLLLLVNTIAFGFILRKPDQQLETYLLAAGWGWGTGWKWTTDRLVASTIIPVGQDAELMGTYLFSGQVLTWLPPLVYTALNEAGVEARFAVTSLGIWFVLGIAALMAIGDYRVAVEAAGRGRMIHNETTTGRTDSARDVPDHDVPANDRQAPNEPLP